MGAVTVAKPLGSSRRARAGTLFPYDLGNVVHTLEDMPLLKRFVDRHSPAQPLLGATALFIQHQLGNVGPQVEALVRLGLDPKQIHWLDIPYTSSERFRVEISNRLGIPEENFWVNRYRVLEPYPSHQLRRAQEIIRHLLRNAPRKLLVLDDGAYFLEAAMAFSRQFREVAIVEQTTRGLIKLDDNRSLRAYAEAFRIVNVARSKPKLALESPWIGAAVLLALEKHLRDLGSLAPQFRVNRASLCLVLGYGTIGRQVAHYLRSFVQVHVFDAKAIRRKQAAHDGFPIWSREYGPGALKLVVGCSGRHSFGVEDYRSLDSHAVLVSASSGSVELSRNDFIDFASTSRIDDIFIETDRLLEDRIHQALWMRLVDRRAVFLNAGFPINFDGRLNCIPARYMQPTALLMVQGAVQALSSPEPGLVPISRKFSRNLTRAFSAHLNPDERKALRQY
jgi:S-adenosylhomocysteine hydrolase